MLVIALTERTPFTASLSSLFFCCFAFIAWRLPFFVAPSLFQTHPAGSLVGPKVMLLSDKQWLSLARSKPHHTRLCVGYVCSEKKKPPKTWRLSHFLLLKITLRSRTPNKTAFYDTWELKDRTWWYYMILQRAVWTLLLQKQSLTTILHQYGADAIGCTNQRPGCASWCPSWILGVPAFHQLEACCEIFFLGACAARDVLCQSGR